MTDAKEMERLQASLEKIVGTSSRSLQRTASKRPMIGDGGQSSNKSLLSGLMGLHLLYLSSCPDLFHLYLSLYNLIACA